MQNEAMMNLRNVILMALADGKVSKEEKQFIEKVRTQMNISDEDFKQLCQEIKTSPRKFRLPQDDRQASESIQLLVNMAASDGDISASERHILVSLAEAAGVTIPQLDAMLDNASGITTEQQIRTEHLVNTIYQEFGNWDEQTQKAKLDELSNLGRAATIPLLRILESYRKPEGTADALELKTMVVRRLGQIGDVRAVYYLAQQITIGDTDDDISNTGLREASAEAIGKITNTPFTSDQAGVNAARLWWTSEASKKYNQLAF